ncbi:hypothetical protein B0J14DRAFT_555936 [Halenospora varia]|nr:hypothetical protein B0J14DRAFT_555936 [Halenospora varia]
MSNGTVEYSRAGCTEPRLESPQCSSNICKSLLSQGANRMTLCDDNATLNSTKWCCGANNKKCCGPDEVALESGYTFRAFPTITLSIINPTATSSPASSISSMGNVAPQPSGYTYKSTNVMDISPTTLVTTLSSTATGIGSTSEGSANIQRNSIRTATIVGTFGILLGSVAIIDTVTWCRRAGSNNRTKPKSAPSSTKATDYHSEFQCSSGGIGSSNGI